MFWSNELLREEIGDPRLAEPVESVHADSHSCTNGDTDELHIFPKALTLKVLKSMSMHWRGSQRKTNRPNPMAMDLISVWG